MNEIKVLTNKEVFGFDFNIYGTGDEPLFLAKDIAEWIGHSDLSRMVNLVDDEEKLKRTLYVTGQNREYWFLTEDGMYEVLMQSRKPIAKKFKKKVKAILKELRTKGEVKLPTSPNEIISLLVEGQNETHLKVETIEKDVNHLMNNQRLDASEYGLVTKAVSERIRHIKKTYALTSSRVVNKNLYQDINTEIKKMTGVSTRSQLKQKHLDDVLDMINHWQPAQSTMYLIRQSTIDDMEVN
ncbi:ORF6C domain-containing protein [Mammaliicoccus sciuri]|uniref:BRO family protein n=1 Tax=Mammaliicoccus sciuri TaxID=1296 RepID=UPI000CD2171A|nr:ORF6C domain-containing protein [Mammaliicoccus sciuri]MCC2087934.1 ORF6C domain-containing protein [Mammaliicoccus sciuri]PNZ30018.1 hypothetical protein CD114_01310 [Mammaliicoccus sciuri]